MVRTRSQTRNEQHYQQGQDRVWDFMVYGLRKTNDAMNKLIMEINELLSYTRDIRNLAENQIRNLVIQLLHRINRLNVIKDKFVAMGDIGQVYQLRIREISQLEKRVKILLTKVNKELTQRNTLQYVHDIGINNETGQYIYITNDRKI